MGSLKVPSTLPQFFSSRTLFSRSIPLSPSIYPIGRKAGARPRVGGASRRRPARSRRRSRRVSPDPGIAVPSPEEDTTELPGSAELSEMTSYEHSRTAAIGGRESRSKAVSENGELIEEESSQCIKNGPHKTRSFIGSIRCFGVDLSPDNIAVAMVYFVQGVLGLSRLAVSFYLKDDLHLDPAETAVVSGFSALPWLVKPLYGFISDSFPLFGYRRRSYLVLSGLLGALSWSLMATFVDSKYGAAFCILLGSLSVAFSDVVVDSMVVERARGESRSISGSLQSLCWGSSAFGGIVSAYFSGSLVGSYGVRFVFGVTAFLPLLTSAVAVLVNEQSVSRGRNLSLSSPGFIESSKQSILQLWDAVRQPNIFLPTLFLFLWQATPQSDSAMFYFTTNVLHFTPEFLGRVKLVTSVASLLGVALYNGFLKEVPLRKIFFLTTILGSALGLTQLILVTGLNRDFGLSDEWFAVGDSLILTVLSQASFMPVLVLAARLCPEGIEATLFATLMSISNAGGLTGGLLGAGLTQIFGVTKENFDHLGLLIIVCNLSSLLPLPLLRLLPNESSETASLKSTDIEETKLR